MTKIFDIIHLNNEMYMIDCIEKDPTYEIKDGQPSYDFEHKRVHIKTERGFGRLNLRLILASTDKSLCLPLLPDIEEGIEVNRLAEETFPKEDFRDSNIRHAYFLGYIAARAKKYTEEDIQKILDSFTAEAPGFYIKKYFLRRLKEANPLPKQVEVKIQNCGVEDEGCIGRYDGKWDNGTTYTMGYRLVLVNNFVQVKRWIYE